MVKCTIPLLLLADHAMCPWDNAQLRNYFFSVRITSSSMSKTLMTTYFITLSIGLKFTRNTLTRHEIKIIIMSALAAYLNYSLFTLGTFTKALAPITSFLMGLFCILMISVVNYF